MWSELQKVSSLRYVSSPLLMFNPQNGASFPEKWVPGIEYKLKLSLFNTIPLGGHVIKIVTINEAEKTIISNEYGHLAKIWNHTIKIKRIDENKIEYEDEIEIQAGVLTLFIWLFAQVFYRHRQRRWKRMLGS